MTTRLKRRGNYLVRPKVCNSKKRKHRKQPNLIPPEIAISNPTIPFPCMYELDVTVTDTIAPPGDLPGRLELLWQNGLVEDGFTPQNGFALHIDSSNAQCDLPNKVTARYDPEDGRPKVYADYTYQ